MTFRTISPRWVKAALLAALAVGGLAVLPGRGEASSAVLRKQLREFAGDLKKILDERKQTKISVGQFVGPPQLAAYAGPGLALILKDNLKELGVTVEPLAELGVKGEFRRVRAAKGKPPNFELRLQLVDDEDNPVQEFHYGIVDPADIALILGVIGPLGPGTREDRLRDVWERLANPRPTLKGTRVYSHPAQPYALEVVVENRPRGARLKGKLPFVGIERGESYAIRVYNHSNEDTAVLLAIDGINVFFFNEDPEKDGTVRKDHLVFVRKKSSTVVRGWYRKGGKSDAFLVTKYSESKAGELGMTAEVGTITALFRIARKKAPPPPPRAEKDDTLRFEFRDEAPGSGTGSGKELADPWTTLGDRLLSPVFDVITVRYTRD
jgi:hypothetical protein